MTTITMLPVDFRGTLASNRKTGEEHTLNKANGRVNRMFTPDFGAFYTESLEVRQADGKLLERDKDYVTTYYYDELGDLTAKEICAIIVVTNPAVTADVRITYQAFGGAYALSLKELKAVLDETEALPGKIKWEDIIDKPLAYVPSDHTHEYWQLYGLESTDENLVDLGNAWAVGRKAVIEDNRFYYQNYIQLAQAAVDSYKLKVMAHITDQDNPHDTDKIKIRLGNVNNWPMADVAQSEDKTIDDIYQPIGGVFNQLAAYVQPRLNDHVNNKDNPHQVRLDDPLLNLYSSEEILDMFDKRLARTQIATDSARYAGLPVSEVWDNIRSGLDVSNIDPTTKFNQSQFAPIPPGMDPSRYALSGSNKYILFEDSLKVYNDTAGSIWFVGSTGGGAYQAAWNAITAFDTANNLSIGTWVIGQYAVSFSGIRDSTMLLVAEKTANGMVPRI